MEIFLTIVIVILVIALYSVTSKKNDRIVELMQVNQQQEKRIENLAETVDALEIDKKGLSLRANEVFSGLKNANKELESTKTKLLGANETLVKLEKIVFNPKVYFILPDGEVAKNVKVKANPKTKEVSYTVRKKVDNKFQDVKVIPRLDKAWKIV